MPEKGVPEGLSISNILANIYLNSIDVYYSHINNIFYCRYVDDILLLCNLEDFETLKKCISEQLNELNLDIHPFDDGKKTSSGLILNGFSYLGYQLSLNDISVKPTTKDRFEHSLERLFSDQSKDIDNNKSNYDLFIWRLNLKISGCIFDHKKYGWMFFYSQITDLQILKHMDWLVAKLFLRYKIPNPQNKIKSFFRTYFEIKYNLNNSNYFTNTDRMTLDNMRCIISDVFHLPVPEEENEVEKTFFKFFCKNIKDLEKDIQFFS